MFRGERSDIIAVAIGLACVVGAVAFGCCRFAGSCPWSWWWLAIPIAIPVLGVAIEILVQLWKVRGFPSVMALTRAAADLATILAILTLQLISTLFRKSHGTRFGTGRHVPGRTAASPVCPLDNEVDSVDHVVAPVPGEVIGQRLIGRNGLARGERSGAVEIDIRKARGEFFDRAGE